MPEQTILTWACHSLLYDTRLLTWWCAGHTAEGTSYLIPHLSHSGVSLVARQTVFKALRRSGYYRGAERPGAARRSLTRLIAARWSAYEAEKMCLPSGCATK